MKRDWLPGKTACDKVRPVQGSLESRVRLLNIKQIRYFASAVAYGSLTAAAKHEYVSVQAISKSLSDLERELGYSLFSRKSHGIAPTAFGNAFLREATSVLKGFERLETFATCWGGGARISG
ncbi:LysR family transcriptional regulator [Eggerthella sp. HF-4214]|uniref:LysR family transcriptional regulator n=1 Tax=Eggerthella guodeyinii TaxID=2690837 RepID=A0A6N7RNC9_9ACTN|nr:LysR family transcriptional regulator [Eggerthella guodeyinii]